MKIVIELDVTNDDEEIGVTLDCLPESLIDHAIEAVNNLGLSAKTLKCTGIKTSIKGD